MAAPKDPPIALRPPTLHSMVSAMRHPYIAIAALFLLAGCSGPTAQTTSPVVVPGSPSTQTTDAGPGTPQLRLADSGFGQDGAYVQGIAIVSTDSEAAVGEFVTVSMNFLDAKGEIVGTEEQVESFSWAGQNLVLPVWLDLSDTPKVKVAKVDVSMALSDHGSSTASRAPMTEIKASTIKKQQYGTGYTAVFQLKNAGTEPLEDARVGIVCYSASGKINGGTSDYPSLIAPSKTVRLSVDVTTSGKPANCTASPNYSA